MKSVDCANYKDLRKKDMRVTIIAILLSGSLLLGCAPEVGSEEWCEDMAEKPKGDWTANEAKEFAKNCVFKKYED